MKPCSRLDFNKAIDVMLANEGFESRTLTWEITKKRKRHIEQLKNKKQKSQSFYSIPTLTDILELDKKFNSEKEKIEYKYKYIKEQLANNPELEFWDYGNYFQSSVHKKQFNNKKINGKCKKIKVSTKGNVIWVNDQNVYIYQTHTKENYHVIEFNNSAHMVHRFVLSTFIPIPKYLDEIGYAGLYCNHIDAKQWNNDFSNLEWVTPSGNIIHALGAGLKVNYSGLEHYLTIPLLLEVVVPNLFKEIKFIRAGGKIWNPSMLTKALIGEKKIAYGCKVKMATKEDLVEHQIGIPKIIIDHFSKDPNLFNPNITSFKFEKNNTLFYLMGDKEIKNAGFDPINVHRAAKRNGTTQGHKVTIVPLAEIHQWKIDTGLLPPI